MTNVPTASTPTSPLLVLLAALPALAGCASAARAQRDGPDGAAGCGLDWRRQVVYLEVEGFALAGQHKLQGEWAGTGVWMGPQTLLTNAHVVRRSSVVRGRDEDGRRFVFERLAGLDLVHDLAVLSVTGTGGPAGAPVWRGDYATLKGEAVTAVGNTAGGGGSVYHGTLNNVADFPPDCHTLIHDTAVAGGVSGGPLYLRRSCEVLGINYAIQPQLRRSLAVSATCAQASSSWRAVGRGLTDFYKADRLQDLPLATPHNFQDVCLPAGTRQPIKFPIDGSRDYVFMVRTNGARGGVVIEEHTTGDRLAVPIDSGGLWIAKTSLTSQPVTITLVAMDPARDTCFTGLIAGIDW